MSSNNYYQLLEIESYSCSEEIKKAYKKKAKEFHPDTNNNSLAAKKMFQMITDAKDTLLDANKRLEYDYKEGIKKREQNKPVFKGNDHNKKRNRNLIAVSVFAFFAGLLFGNARKNRK